MNSIVFFILIKRFALLSVAAGPINGSVTTENVTTYRSRFPGHTATSSIEPQTVETTQPAPKKFTPELRLKYGPIVPTRTDATRTNATRTDVARTDTTRTDLVRTDATRMDATRTDATRMDATRTDATRTDLARTGATRTGATRTDSARTDHKTTTESPTPAVFDPDKRMIRVVCSYRRGSNERLKDDHFRIQDVNPKYCTDLMYEGVTIEDVHLFSHTPWTDALFDNRVDGNLFDNVPTSLPEYIQLGEHKLSHPNLRLFLTVGQTDGEPFEEILLHRGKFLKFINSLITIFNLFEFNGVNIRWLYPRDKTILTEFLVALRAGFHDALEQKRIHMKAQLAVTLSGNLRIIEELYELRKISDVVDQISFIAYDLDSPSNVTRPISELLNETPEQCNISVPNEVNDPSYNDSTSFSPTEWRHGYLDMAAIYGNDAEQFDKSNEMTEKTKIIGPQNWLNTFNDQIESTVKPIKDEDIVPRNYETIGSIQDILNEAIENGVDRHKINIAVSLRGRIFELRDANSTGIGAPSVKNFKYHKTIRYNQMCTLTAHGSGHEVTRDKEAPYWFYDNKWISYENENSLKHKVAYLRDIQIGGILVDSQGEDDFTGHLCPGGNPYAMSNLIYVLADVQPENNVSMTPMWTFCKNCSPRMTTIPSLAVIATFIIGRLHHAIRSII